MIQSEEITSVLAQVKNVKRQGDGYTARCPAHNDDRNSLSIGTGRDGKLLLSCHAGCQFPDILSKLDLPRKRPMTTAEQEIVYPYVSESGALLYEVVRRLPKQFIQRRPKMEGGYEYNIRDVRRVLYRLPEIIEAVSLDRTIFIVEGEKDVATLTALGLEATTSSGGAAAQWFPEYNETLRGADVVILPDNDEPGKAHAQKVTDALRGIARNVRTINLPGLEGKEDVTDWVTRHGGTAEKLQALLEQKSAPAPISRYQLSDDIEIESLPDPVWLMDKILPADSTAALVGPSGSYKSFVALDWCFHLCTGLDWCGNRCEVGSVVYFCGEGKNGLKKRLAAVKAANGYSGRLGIYFQTNSVGLNDPSETAKAIAAVQERGIKPKLIVIDTLARYLVGDENTAKDMGSLIRAADEMRFAFGCSVLIVHHTGKDLTKGGRGNSAFNCGVDTEFVAEKPEGEMRVTLINTKQKDGPLARSIELEAVSSAGSLALKWSGLTFQKLEGKRLASLLAVHENDEGDGLSNTAWKALVCGDSKTLWSGFNNHVKWLKEQGYVALRGGRYSVSDAGKMAIRSTQSTASPQLVHTTQEIQSTQKGVYIGTHLEDQTLESDYQLTVSGIGGLDAA